MQRFSKSPGRPSVEGRRRLAGSTLTFALALSLGWAGATPLRAQDAGVAGTVVEARSGRPLVGAQVAVQGTQHGTLSDANGRFVIPDLGGPQGTLNVVMLGYRQANVPVRAGQGDLRIELDEMAVALDEVVVTGTVGGTQKRAIGNSVAQIKAAEVVATEPIRSMQELINGRAPGVVVMPGTGMVGSGSKIRIRGNSTFSLTTDPLIYVDGVRVNNESTTGYTMQAFGNRVISRLNDFDPNEIESIEILRGPAAATLYGTEAARGVINIITKKGAPGGTRYSFQVKQGANWLMNPEGRFYTNYWRNPATGEVETLNSYVHGKELGYNMLRTGHVDGYNASVSGGNQAVRYFASADLSQQQGAEPDNFRNQFSGRANVQIVPNEKIDIQVNTGYVTNRTALSCEAGCGGLMWTTTFGTPANLPENRCDPGEVGGCGYYHGFRSGPPKVDRAMRTTQGIGRYTGSFTANWRPLKFMTHRLTVGTDVTQETNIQMLPYQVDDTIRYFWGDYSANGWRDNYRRAITLNTFDYAGTLNFDVLRGLNSATSFGLQYYQKHTEYIEAYGENFAGPGLSTVQATAVQPFASDDFEDNNTLGFYGQEMFGWKDRLFLTVAARVDNNSSFGSDLKWVFYPKASLSWVLNEEPSVRERMPDFINTFKLRLAYGENGTPPGAFTALRTFRPATGPGNTPAVTPDFLGNPKLGPEIGKEFELGFDAGFLEDRVGLEFTYYHTKTVDAILNRQVAPSTGFAGQDMYVNAGAILNQGIEATLRGQAVRTKNFDWDLTLTAATNKGKVLKLADQDTAIFSGDIAWKLGHEPRAFFLPRIVSAEYDPATKQAINLMCDDGQGGSMACYDGNTVVAPRVYLGRSTPALEGSIGSSITLFKQLHLNALVDFKTGYKKGDGNSYVRCYFYAICRERMYPEEYDPKLIAGMLSNNRLRDWLVRDASFAKLREISVTYQLPSRYVGAFGARSASVNVAMRNLHTWTSWTGLDPESQYLANSNYEQDALPQLTSFLMTFNVNF